MKGCKMKGCRTNIGVTVRIDPNGSEEASEMERFVKMLCLRHPVLDESEVRFEVVMAFMKTDNPALRWLTANSRCIRLAHKLLKRQKRFACMCPAKMDEIFTSTGDELDGYSDKDLWEYMLSRETEPVRRLVEITETITENYSKAGNALWSKAGLDYIRGAIRERFIEEYNPAGKRKYYHTRDLLLAMLSRFRGLCK